MRKNADHINSIYIEIRCKTGRLDEKIRLEKMRQEIEVMIYNTKERKKK